MQNLGSNGFKKETKLRMLIEKFFKAFDTLNRTLLLCILITYGLDEGPLTLSDKLISKNKSE